MTSLVENKDWVELQKLYNQFGDTLNIKELFDKDPQRFANNRYVLFNMEVYFKIHFHHGQVFLHAFFVYHNWRDILRGYHLFVVYFYP